MNRLVLIDGNAILHRAYHALPPLTSSDGRIVNAVYGFTSMLFRLIHDLNPTHIAVAFDRPAPTFRKKLFADYQIKRPKMDDALVGQISIVHDLLATLHIPIFELDGFEADDVIGTIIKKLSAISPQPSDGIDQSIIVTGDRDILQLVEDEKVFVYMPVKGLSEGKLYGEKETIERLGVKPNRIPDYKALAGDASDNYPGIPGIGPKTAVDILAKAGSLEELYKQIETKNFGLSSGLVKKIIEGKESALLSYELATIKQDVPLQITIPFLSKEQFQNPEVLQFLQTLGFQSLVKRLLSVAGLQEKEIPKKEEKSTEQLALV
jgi:DNA polymerase-1